MQDKINNTLALLDNILDLVSDLNKTRPLSIIKTKLEESKLCLVGILTESNLKYIELDRKENHCGRTAKLIKIKTALDELLISVDMLCNNGGISVKRGTREKAEIAYDNVLVAGLWILEEIGTKEDLKKEVKIIEDHAVEVKNTALTRVLNYIFKN